VFNIVSHTLVDKPLQAEERLLCLFNGTEYSEFSGEKPLSHGLGYQGKAISLGKGSAVTYPFELTQPENTVLIEVNLAPNHPVEGTLLRYSVSIDGESPQIVDYHTEGRSEEWKMNVLGNRATRITRHAIQPGKPHALTVTALDEGVVLDQIRIKESVH
jgi:hypothetical protein